MPRLLLVICLGLAALFGPDAKAQRIPASAAQHTDLVRDCFKTLPKKLRDRCSEQNVRVVMVRSLQDAPLPAKRQQQWISVRGTFQTLKGAPRIYLPHWFLHQGRIQRVVDVDGIFLHELGHAYDWMSGLPSATSRFLTAYEHDRKRLPRDIPTRFQHFLQPGDRGAKESFAEAFCICLRLWCKREAPTVHFKENDINFRRWFPSVVQCVAEELLVDLYDQPRRPQPQPTPAPAARIAKQRQPARPQPTVSPGRKAIQHGINWLVAQQQGDGSWSFDPPSADFAFMRESRVLATSMVLLPLLDEYPADANKGHRAAVQNGLRFLASRSRLVGDRLLLEDTVNGRFSQAVATAVLAKAAKVHERGSEIASWAQLAANQLVDSYDRNQGGWREPSMMHASVGLTAWCLSALHEAELTARIPDDVSRDVLRFLDAPTNGRRPGANAWATHAWCRRQLGWIGETLHPANESRRLTEISADDLLAIWLITRSFSGEREFRAAHWVRTRCDQLIGAQHSTADQQLGSWPAAGPEHRTAWGGRLYRTALATLVLQEAGRL